MAKIHLVPSDRARRGRLILRAACGRLATAGVLTETNLAVATCAQCVSTAKARRVIGACPNCLLERVETTELDVHGDCPRCDYHSSAVGLWFRGFHYA